MAASQARRAAISVAEVAAAATVGVAAAATAEVATATEMVVGATELLVIPTEAEVAVAAATAVHAAMAMAEAARARSVMHEMRKSRCRNFAHTLPRRASQRTGPQLSSLSKSRACYPEHQHTPSPNCEGAVAESSCPMRPMVHHLRSLSGAKRSRKTLPQKWR